MIKHLITRYAGASPQGEASYKKQRKTEKFIFMLTSKQRAYLRGMANSYDTIYQIGKGGISDMMVTGTRFVLYRESTKKKRIELPK